MDHGGRVVARVLRDRGVFPSLHPVGGTSVPHLRRVKNPARIAACTAAALDLALGAPFGPTFVDYPLDIVFGEAEVEIPTAPQREASPAEGVEEAATVLAAAERPAIMAGTGLYWGAERRSCACSRRSSASPSSSMGSDGEPARRP